MYANKSYQKWMVNPLAYRVAKRLTGFCEGYERILQTCTSDISKLSTSVRTKRLRGWSEGMLIEHV